MTVKGDSGNKYEYYGSFKYEEFLPHSSIIEHLDDNFRLASGDDDPGKDIAPGFREFTIVLLFIYAILAFLGYGIWWIAAAWGS